MGLLSFLKRSASTVPSADAGDDVQRVRTRARQRIIGAGVLIVAGVIGFPLLFETQPRPIPVDIPIEIVRKDQAPPLVMPPARARAASAVASKPATKDNVITETAADAGRVVAAAPPSAVAASAPSSTPPAKADKAPAVATAVPKADKASAPIAAAPKAEKQVAVAATKDAPKEPAKQAPKELAKEPPKEAKEAPKEVAKKDDAAGAQGRFVVQVGAFSDATAAREMRQKVEKLGLKTFTQVVETADGRRIRVRVGPFASREDAEKAADKVKSAGLSTALFPI
jgi:DedD protein